MIPRRVGTGRSPVRFSMREVPSSSAKLTAGSGETPVRSECHSCRSRCDPGVQSDGGILFLIECANSSRNRLGSRCRVTGDAGTVMHSEQGAVHRTTAESPTRQFACLGRMFTVTGRGVPQIDSVERPPEAWRTPQGETFPGAFRRGQWWVPACSSTDERRMWHGEPGLQLRAGSAAGTASTGRRRRDVGVREVDAVHGDRLGRRCRPAGRHHPQPQRAARHP